MKTSDKLLLTFFLSALGIFIAAHLVLYVRYRNGDFLTEKELNKELFITYQGPVPASVSIRGNLLVRIIPSDRFSIEMEKENSLADGEGIMEAKVAVKGATSGGFQKTGYEIQGDTLILRGSSFPQIDPRGAWQAYDNFPRVNIYAGQLKSIRLSGGMVVLKGEEKPGQFNTDLITRNALLWIGESDENFQMSPAPENYGSIHIHADSSKLFLFPNASVKDLAVQLDGWSEIDEQHARIDRSVIACSANSRINMTGANLKNLRVPTGLSPPDH